MTYWICKSCFAEFKGRVPSGENVCPECKKKPKPQEVI